MPSEQQYRSLQVPQQNAGQDSAGFRIPLELVYSMQSSQKPENKVKQTNKSLRYTCSTTNSLQISIASFYLDLLEIIYQHAQASDSCIIVTLNSTSLEGRE